MLKQVISLSCPLSDRFYTKSVEYRLTYQDRHSCKRQEAKGRINNQFLITGFRIIHSQTSDTSPLRTQQANVAHHPPQIALNNQQKPFNGRCALGLLCERPAGKQMSASIAEFLPKSI